MRSKQEKKSEYDRLRRIKKKEEISLKAKKYREENREKLNEDFRKRYAENKEYESDRKRKYYIENKNKILLKCKEYREVNPKEKTGKTGTGNYNITLAERNKKEWLEEELFFYKLKITDTDGTVFYKCGLAKNIRNRLYHIPYKVDVIEAVRMKKYDAIYFEKDILNNKIRYSPLIKFGGHTECFID